MVGNTRLLVGCSIANMQRRGNVHMRASGKIAVTIYSVEDLDGLPIHFVVQLMEITGFVHPKQALAERPDLLPICSLL